MNPDRAAELAAMDHAKLVLLTLACETKLQALTHAVEKALQQARIHEYADRPKPWLAELDQAVVEARR